MPDDLALSIIVPTYNERDNLAPLARRVDAALTGINYELLIIDDNSPDETADHAAELAAEFPIRCVVRRDERDLSTAVVRGLREARGVICVVMDADLSHPPESIPELAAALRDPDVEMAIGSRFVAGGTVDLEWPAHRRLISWVGRQLARPLTPARDMVAGFFAVRREDVDVDRLHPVGYKIALELIVRHGWTNVVELPISFQDRAAGKTKLTFAEQGRYLRHLGRLYSCAIARVWREHPATLALAAFTIVYAVTLCIVAAIRTAPDSTSDFRDFWENADHWRRTGSISVDLGVHNYLPFFTLMMAPWALLPMPVAAAGFVALSLLLFSLTAAASAQLLELLNHRRRSGLVLLVAIGLAIAYVHAAAVLGQMGLLLLFLCIVAWTLALRGQESAAGLALGLAAIIKLLPGVLIVYFLLQRRWRVVASAAATIVLLGIGAPTLLLGPQESWRMHNEFINEAAIGGGSRATILAEKPQKAKYSNSALPIVLRRVLTSVDAHPQEDRPGFFVNVVDWPRQGVWRLYLVIVGLLLAVSAAVVWRGPRWSTTDPPNRSALHAQFAVFNCLMLLLSPLVWTHYLVLAFWPLIVIADYGHRRGQAGRPSSVASVALLAWFAGVVLLAWPAARAAGAQLVPVFILWAASVWIALVRGTRATASAQSPAPRPAP